MASKIRGTRPDLIIIDDISPFDWTPYMSIKKKTNSRIQDKSLQLSISQIEQVLDVIIPHWEDNPSTVDTPRRFVEYLAEYTQDIPYDRIFNSVFALPENASHSIITQVNIPFRGMCEHHLLPMWGKAHLGYIPADHVIGLSKMVRLVQAVGVEKPSLQEHYADRILSLMTQKLKPAGVALVIESEHSCMACRGVNAPGVPTITSMVAGVFAMNPYAKQEFMDLIKLGKASC